MGEFLHYLTFPFLLQGAVVAVELLVGAMTGGIVIGFFLALAAGAPQFWIRLPIQAYIYLIRGTPMLLQLILLFNVLPQAGIRLSAFQSALLALTINETAFCAEIIRGGIASVDRSQRLACEAFGFSRRAQMIHVVIPQALRAIIPTLGNEAVGLLKSTSLASVVGVNELTLRSQTIVSQNFEFLPVLLASGAMYIVMSSILAGGQWWMESRFGLDRRAQRAARRAVTVVPDTTPASPYPVPSQGTALEFRGASVSYGSVMVLKDISLTIRSGEVIALLGRSGLRQEHPAEGHPGARADAERRDPRLGQTDRAHRNRAADAGPPTAARSGGRARRHGVPELCTVRPHDGAAERHDGSGHRATYRARRSPAARSPRARCRRPWCLRGPAAARTLGRAAAARRHRPCAGGRAVDPIVR